MASPPDQRRSGEQRPRAGTEISSSEDFLFHLYRGSELLQDDRVHDAKEELEAALRLQPMDPKGQDLLAVVYFRLGMYPRAIEIFAQLVRDYPEERTPRINLALSYLKTGQPVMARQLLEESVQRQPENPRAWAYLGLACERLGDYVIARDAFKRGGHEAMARRMDELLGEQEARPPSTPSRPPPPTFEELEKSVAMDVAPASMVPASRRAPGPSQRPPSSVRPGSMSPPPVSLGAMRAPSAFPPPPQSPSGIEAPSSRMPSLDLAEDLARSRVLVFPKNPGISASEGGLLRVTAGEMFAVRMELVRAVTHTQGGALATDVLSRRARGKLQEQPLGGGTSPLVAIRGAAHLLLGPRFGRKIVAVALEDTIYLREDALLAFDGALSYENGRLAVGEGDAIPMVQLRGTGHLVVEIEAELSSLEVTPADALSVRRELVLGWLGRLVPRALPLSEAPAGQRGLVAFSGDGLVLIDAGGTQRMSLDH